MYAETLSNDLKFRINNTLLSDIKIKGNDGVEINAHRVILAVRSEVFKRMLLNGMKESLQEVIEFPEVSSDTLHVILEYLYTGRVTEQTLTIEMVAEAFHGADYFLLEQLKCQIIEFFKNHLRNNNVNKINISAKVLSRLLECMESTNNEFVNLLCDSINSMSLKSIEYLNLNFKALEYILSNVKREEGTKIFSISEYDLFHYVILWAANEISEEALSFYESCLPSSKTLKNFNRNSNVSLDIYNIQGHAKYQSTMITKTYPLLNLVKLERIHPFIISNIIEPLDGLIDSKTLIGVYRKQALLAGKHICLNDISLQWDDNARGSNMYLKSTSVVVSNSLSHEWIRIAVPISGQDIFEWDIVVEEICDCFWVGICTIKEFDVDYNSWLGKQAYGWVFGSNGAICHNTQEENGPYTNKYGKEFKKNDRITVHLDMGERTCSFSINGERYPIAFRDLPNEIYPAVSLRTPGRARIEPRQ
ncbi:BTB-domain-containing protein [Rhizophagus irregularis]|uniref:BTB-domain-containing protein n=1 Tax=Rhizophagus irregularis TaxID=588596 RepID=A0A2N1NZW6_9GLOM|nr:BTB-domain-containing protein [Rhizophagus irregularis]